MSSRQNLFLCPECKRTFWVDVDRGAVWLCACTIYAIDVTTFGSAFKQALDIGKPTECLWVGRMEEDGQELQVTFDSRVLEKFRTDLAGGLGRAGGDKNRVLAITTAGLGSEGWSRVPIVPPTPHQRAQRFRSKGARAGYTEAMRQMEHRGGIGMEKIQDDIAARKERPARIEGLSPLRGFIDDLRRAGNGG